LYRRAIGLVTLEKESKSNPKKGGKAMILLNNYRLKEGKSQDAVYRRLINGIGTPEGIRVLAKWTRADGTGGYLIFETDKPEFAWTPQWSNLLDMDVIPLYDTKKDVPWFSYSLNHFVGL
jgi:hypothetical protein